MSPTISFNEEVRLREHLVATLTSFEENDRWLLSFANHGTHVQHHLNEEELTALRDLLIRGCSPGSSHPPEHRKDTEVCHCGCESYAKDVMGQHDHIPRHTPDGERTPWGWWRIVALPEGTGGQVDRLPGRDARQALAIFQANRGIVGVLQDDPEYGVILNGDRLVYAALP